jgi:hypothetical protein
MLSKKPSERGSYIWEDLGTAAYRHEREQEQEQEHRRGSFLSAICTL